MSEDRNRGSRDFSRYDAMETEALEDILRADFQAPEGQESDEEMLFYVMEVLAERRRNDNNFTGNTAQQAYESFRRDYEPREEAPRRAGRWLRSLTAAAAVLAVVLLGTVTTSAFGFDIWQTVGKWARETFHFDRGGQTQIEEPVSDIDLPYGSLEEAIFTLEKATDIVPTWFPEGYELTEIEILENPQQKIYLATYDNGEKRLKIQVQSYLEGYPEQIEQSEGFVETYVVSDVTYYIFSNYDLNRAVWINDRYECYISGEVTIEELKTMIDSI